MRVSSIISKKAYASLVLGAFSPNKNYLINNSGAPQMLRCFRFEKKAFATLRSFLSFSELWHFSKRNFSERILWCLELGKKWFSSLMGIPSGIFGTVNLMKYFTLGPLLKHFTLFEPGTGLQLELFLACLVFLWRIHCSSSIDMQRYIIDSNQGNQRS